MNYYDAPDNFQLLMDDDDEYPITSFCLLSLNTTFMPDDGTWISFGKTIPWLCLAKNHRPPREPPPPLGHATTSDLDYESAEAKKQVGGSKSTKRSHAADVHNLSERRRRDRINEMMRALQELIPRCNKSDKASMLDEAIEYLKSLQLQVQMTMSMGCGMVPMMMCLVMPFPVLMGPSCFPVAPHLSRMPDNLTSSSDPIHSRIPSLPHGPHQIQCHLMQLILSSAAFQENEEMNLTEGDNLFEVHFPFTESDNDATRYRQAE